MLKVLLDYTSTFLGLFDNLFCTCGPIKELLIVNFLMVTFQWRDRLTLLHFHDFAIGELIQIKSRHFLIL